MIAISDELKMSKTTARNPKIKAQIITDIMRALKTPRASLRLSSTRPSPTKLFDRSFATRPPNSVPPTRFPRSKTPDLVRQEFYGLIMAQFAIRDLMHQAALKADEYPDRLSFIHGVRVIRRKLAAFNTFPPLKRMRYFDGKRCFADLVGVRRYDADFGRHNAGRIE